MKLTKKQRVMLQRILAGLGLFVLGLVLPFGNWVNSVLFVCAWLLAGYDVLLEAVQKIGKAHFLDESFLMTVASICAVLLGETDEAAAVMLFFQVGELFQSIAVERSRRSVAELMDLRPDVAYLIRDKEVEEVDPEDVQVGDMLRVLPGERIPVDGMVVEGCASVDTSKITGESVPRDVAPGEKVLSGCINLSGVLTVRAESAFEGSTVARILELMDSAAEGKSNTEDLIARFARYYTPCVVGLAGVIALIVPLFDGFAFTQWVYRALNFLVVSCPCALVISVPLAFFGGMGAVSKAGMIAKGGIALENLAKVDTVAFDKTGTLTTGAFRVVRVDAPEPDKLLRRVAALEQYSNHPIAQSIVAAAGVFPKAENVREIPGQGMEALVEGVLMQVGNHRLLEQNLLPVPDVEGATVVYALENGTYCGAVVLEDTVKPGAKEALNALRALGVSQLCMLTGDRENAAQRTARQLDLSQYHAAMLPQDKLEIVRQLRDQGAKVAFVGDGVNDAPVLTLADVGVAMGGVGSDAAVEASDLVLLKDDLAGLPKAIRLARKTVSIAKQNIWLALVIKFGILGLSVLGYANMYMAVFADVGVAILCILNSFRALQAR